MGRLAVAPRLHDAGEDRLDREERELPGERLLDRPRVGLEPRDEVDRRAEGPVGREEQLREDDAPGCRVVERALEPLVRGRLGEDRAEVRQEPRERAEPLRAHGVPLVGHGRRADLARRERLAHLAGVREEPRVLAHLAERRSEAGERIREACIELARVGLTRERDRPREAELARHEGVQLVRLRRVAREELDEARLGPRRSLGAQAYHR